MENTVCHILGEASLVCMTDKWKNVRRIQISPSSITCQKKSSSYKTRLKIEAIVEY